MEFSGTYKLDAAHFRQRAQRIDNVPEPVFKQQLGQHALDVHGEACFLVLMKNLEQRPIRLDGHFPKNVVRLCRRLVEMEELSPMGHVFCVPCGIRF
jgi:hypothetical protein